LLKYHYKFPLIMNKLVRLFLLSPSRGKEKDFLQRVKNKRNTAKAAL